MKNESLAEVSALRYFVFFFISDPMKRSMRNGTYIFLFPFMGKSDFGGRSKISSGL